MAELLTPSIAYAYNEKAKALPYNGIGVKVTQG